MISTYRASVAAFSGAVILSATFLLMALDPQAPVAGPVGLVAPAGQDRLAQALLLSGGAADVDRALIATRLAAAHAPYDVSALSRVAYIDKLRDGHLDREGVEALTLSYERIPIDRAVGFWRIAFALDNWERMTPDLRRAVQNEVFGMMTEPGHRWPLREVLSQVRNPRARAIAALWRLKVARRQR